MEKLFLNCLNFNDEGKILSWIIDIELLEKIRLSPILNKIFKIIDSTTFYNFICKCLYFLGGVGQIRSYLHVDLTRLFYMFRQMATAGCRTSKSILITHHYVS